MVINVDVISKVVATLSILFFSFGAISGELNSCLRDAQKKTRIIDQRQSIESCFQLNARQVPQHRCFELVNSLHEAKKNQDLLETLNSICFYQTTDFKNIKSCFTAADHFKIADNHDEAIFECYRQFQGQISQKQCIELSRKLTYPAKKGYMLNHCQNDY